MCQRGDKKESEKEHALTSLLLLLIVPVFKHIQGQRETSPVTINLRYDNGIVSPPKANPTTSRNWGNTH
jgi:hypothetical protein